MQKVRISDLPECTDFKGLWTIGTDSGNKSVKVSLESVGDAADNANRAAVNAGAAAESAKSAATEATNAAQSANEASKTATDAASDAESAASDAESAATNANEAADRANKAAESAGSGGSSDMEPITDEEIDELLKNFSFLDSFTVTAEGEYPLTLEAENSAGGAEITGSVDIGAIPENEIAGMFGGN